MAANENITRETPRTIVAASRRFEKGDH
jgi:hypothetical protein